MNGVVTRKLTLPRGLIAGRREDVAVDRMHINRTALKWVLAGVLAVVPTIGWAQLPNLRSGEAVPRDVREIYERGLNYLATTQRETGDWPDGDNGPGTTGLALMTFLASGEDPNFGVYSNVIRRAVRRLILDQNETTGFFDGQSGAHSSMYHHGFAMLALSEAYGAFDDRDLWAGQPKKGKSIGQALELAVRSALTSQKKNPLGGWRYGPDATDADTSVTGSVIVGLLAARNAGIEVPDDAINRTIKYYVSMTSEGGHVGYSGLGDHGDSEARSSIATLVYSIARRKDLPQFKFALKYLVERIGTQSQGGWQEYANYYEAQALFQGDVDAWEKWNKLLVRHLKETQHSDGSMRGSFGPTLGTSMSLLALALNYKFLPIYER